MAIYYFNASVIKRSAGRSATASAAYRAAERIKDERTGEIHDYRKKKGVDEKIILAPNSAPDWVYDRGLLWNVVEQLEKRKDSQVAREIKLAIPGELNRSQQVELVKEFVEVQFVSKGMVADICLHELSSHNPHAHIMLTMREIDETGFNKKKNRDWNKTELLANQREAWSTYANIALKLAGIDSKIDHRTLEEQGINRIPQIHLGSAATAMMKRGVETYKGARYREIEDANKEIRKCEFHLELIDRLESIYKNNPEIESTPPTQKPTIKPPQTSSRHHVINSPETAIKQTSESNQIKETVARNKPLTVSFKQRKQITQTARRFLQWRESDVWNSKQGSQHYNLMTNQSGLLVIEAKDGRGEILRLRDGEIVTQRLTEKDVKQFQKVSIALNQQEKQVADTAERFLHLMGLSTWNSDQGSKNYNLMTDQSGLLVIEAKDGRGEILRRQQDGKIVAQGLTSKDVERFKKINIALSRKLEQVKSQQHNQSRGFGR